MLGKYTAEKTVLRGSKEKKACSYLVRETVGERHQMSRGQMREDQEDGKKELRRSGKKAGKNKSFELHKKSGKERKKTLGT